MAIVFVLGLLCSSLLERRAEVASVFNNKRQTFTDSIVAQNEKFAEDYPREYESWAMTEDTSFESKYNGSQEKDVLAQRPEMVILWAGYAFAQNYNTPRGHRHCIEDLRGILRTGAPGVRGGKELQPGTCWTCKSPDVPRLMREKGLNAFYGAKWSDPKAVFEATYKHEQQVTELINKLADVADAEKDRASINFIDRYIDEQVQEEQTALDILNLFLHRDDHAVALIDDKLATRE